MLQEPTTSNRTKPVRVPEEILPHLRTISGVLGETPGGVLSRAFNEYVANHREEFTAAFNDAKKYIASADVDGLMELTRPSRRERAEAAALRSRQPQ